MEAVEIRDLRIGDAVVEEDEELVVATLQLGERVALVRYVSKGAYVLREQRPNDLVLRLPREALALRATG